MVDKEEKERRKLIDRKFGARAELAAVLASVYPQSAEREFKRYLKKYSKELVAIIDRAEHNIASGKPKKAVLRRVKNEIGKISDKYKPVREIGKIATMVEGIEEAQFRKSFKKTIGIDMPEFDKDTFADERGDWLVGTLTTIGLYLLSINNKIDSASGSSKEEFAKAMSKIKKESAEIGDIARNRVGDLMAGINKKMYNMFGIKRYVWRTRRDRKVRECHKSFDGHIFSTDNPPEIWYETKHGRVYTGRHCNPGEDYNCRCRAIPLFTKDAVWTILTREKWKKEL